MTTAAVDFLSLAEREASRYGGDGMVFLRELLQNARDAGARRVIIETMVEDGVEAISVTDDGRGMAMDHAERFLLTLYASSKRGDAGAAGRFGVGFWSILRFEPTQIRISSRVTEAGEGWEIVFDSCLKVQRRRRRRMPVGTSVRMERPVRSGDLGASAWDLVRRDARHLRQCDGVQALLGVTVNGRLATEKMAPNRPGLSFRRSGLRGVISLGSTPEVTLLAHGLRVRSVAFVDDLLLRPGRRLRRSRRLPTSGLSPRVVVDSDRLAVLMDRGDVAQDRALVAVARVIRSETRRLCEMELERLAPRSVWRKTWDAVVGRRLVVGMGALVLAGAISGMWGAKALNERWSRPRTAVASAAIPAAPEPYVDRSSGYGGPVTGVVDGVGGVPALRFRPAGQRPFLAAFRVGGVDEEGKPVKTELPLRPAGRSGDVSGSSLEIEVDFRTSGSLLRLPVPTGHVVDGASVLLNGHAAELLLTSDDEPVLRLDTVAPGRVVYRTVEGASEGQTDGQWPILPSAVVRMAAGLKELPPRRRIEEAINLVQASLGRSGLFEGARDSEPQGFFGPVFEAGGGDCDVVNTVLAAVLSEAGLRSRLAVGWIGVGGRAAPGLHAWVEVDLGAGRWVPADATIPRRVRWAELEEVAPRQAITPSERTAESRRESEPPSFWWVLGLLGVILAVSVAAAMWHFRIRWVFEASGDLDPGALVESLVRDRDAWPGFAGARRRKLVPAHGEDRQSLAGIEDAASHLALFVAESPGEWVARVREGGDVVIDGSTRAGRVAAAACGAFDLDRWEVLWRRSRTHPFGLEVQEALRRTGLNLELRYADDVPGGGLGFVVNDGVRAWVVIDDAGPDWRWCRDHAQVHRTEAIFRAGDLVVEALQVSGVHAQQAMAELARSAINALHPPSGERTA